MRLYSPSGGQYTTTSGQDQHIEYILYHRLAQTSTWPPSAPPRRLRGGIRSTARACGGGANQQAQRLTRFLDVDPVAADGRGQPGEAGEEEDYAGARAPQRERVCVQNHRPARAEQRCSAFYEAIDLATRPREQNV